MGRYRESNDGPPQDGPRALGALDEALLRAAAAGDDSLLKELIARGANKNCVDERLGRTPLLAAAAAGQLSAVRVLVRSGADLNQTTSEFGDTPIGAAACFGHHEVVLALIKAGADVETVSSRGQYSPLLYAVLNGHSATAKALLAAGADPYQESVLGCSAAALAEHREPDRLGLLLRLHTASGRKNGKCK